MLKRYLYSGVGLVLIGLAFLGFNVLSGVWFSQSRLDLTEHQLYSLSEGSHRILKQLTQPIELEFFFSEEQSRNHPTLRLYARRVKELLNTYVQAAPDYVRLKVIDPVPFSVEEDQATRLGLQAVPASNAGDTLYFGLAGHVVSPSTEPTDASEIIPFFQQGREAFLEYEISRLIQTLAQPERPVVGLLTQLPLDGGFDVLSQQPTGPWMVLEEMRQAFNLRPLQPDVDQIPNEVSILMLVHPKSLSTQTLYAIDQFVLRGGRLLVFVDPYSESDTEGQLDLGLPELNTGLPASNLEPLFKAWGLRLIPDKVVADPPYAIAVNVEGQSRSVPYPGWLSLPAAAFDSQDLVSSELENLTMATAGALEPLPNATTRFTRLVRSSSSAVLVDAQRVVGLENPASLLRGITTAAGASYTLAARLQGPAVTAFPEGIEGRKGGLTQGAAINVLVVADTDLLADRMWVQVQDFFGQPTPHPWADNAVLVINALDSLSGSDALISIRSRGHYLRPFTRVEALRQAAEDQFRAQEDRLQQQLTETERQLASLYDKAPNPETGKISDMTPEQQQAVQHFLQEKLAIRKELREVRYALNADIDQLGDVLKVINIALMPVLLTLTILAWCWRRHRPVAD